jgi:hypothetical protein
MGSVRIRDTFVLCYWCVVFCRMDILLEGLVRLQGITRLAWLSEWNVNPIAAWAVPPVTRRT